MNDLLVRQAQLADANRVAELSGTLGYPVSEDAMEERLKRILKMETHSVFVAERNGEVVGWTHGAEQEMLELDWRGEIRGLVVAESERGRGVGRRLVEAVENWARERGLKDMSVRSNVIRPESHPFYERIGYTRYKTQHAYQKHLGSD
ncbi:MAG TPA: GNAT family N-acetyltransferase [Chthoniobacterales bacterium]|jgi:N-acetylglutamate synthase-like GNAT family acetyltransferase|nr:GNAT family N-acetyltransferase [Chthoniobacterales bacterium]